VLCARDQVAGPFATINADDFYGPASYRALVEFLLRPVEDEASGVDPSPRFAAVAFPLARVLPGAGAVSRALCRTDDEGWLSEIFELRSISRTGDGGGASDEGGVRREYPADAPVSMNLWAFTPAIFDALESEMRAFLVRGAATPADELQLPDVVATMMREGRARVRVLSAGDQWFGVTRRADREDVARRLAERVERGDYPRDLWGSRG
jgi:hypothetical protein